MDLLCLAWHSKLLDLGSMKSDLAEVLGAISLRKDQHAHPSTADRLQGAPLTPSSCAFHSASEEPERLWFSLKTGNQSKTRMARGEESRGQKKKLQDLFQTVGLAQEILLNVQFIGRIWHFTIHYTSST